MESCLALHPELAVTLSSHTTYPYISLFFLGLTSRAQLRLHVNRFQRNFRSTLSSLLPRHNTFNRQPLLITMPDVACNYTILQQDCTLQTCCLNQGTVNYIPTLAGNITYAAIFVPLLALQLGLCLWYRTWTFMVGMVCGLLCEIIGYAGRIWMHYSIFDMSPFLM